LQASKETADIAAEEDKETVANLQEDADYLGKKAGHQYQMVNDPAYRASHVGMEDDTTKEQAREQKQWEQKVKRAYDQQKRGARGKWITETITANETGKAATAAQKELDLAKTNMPLNIEASKVALEAIKNHIEKGVLQRS
jgi:hypothetical protein